MKIKLLFILLIAVGAINSSYAQLQAKAIAYSLTVDLIRFDKEASKEVEQKELLFETDTYYTADKVRTINRTIKTPEEYQLSFRQRLYDQQTTDQYDVSFDDKYMLWKQGFAYKPKSTGKTKTILNYSCKEYKLTDNRGVVISFWVTDKLGKNVSPWGNFSLKGTALEIEASNGITFKATDFASGEVASNFFDIPVDFQVDKIPFKQPAAK